MTITLGGRTDTDLGLVVTLGTQVPILPSTRDRTVDIPFKHGAFDFGSDMGSRIFELECAFTTTTSPTDLQTKVRDLASHLTNTRGESRTLALVFDDEPEKTYNVRYTGNLPIERIAKFGWFTLPLTAFDPFATAALDAFDDTKEYDTLEQYDSGLIYPNARTVQDWANLSSTFYTQIGDPREWAGFVWMFERHMSGQHNHSSIATPLIVEISGNVTNPTITSDTNGQTMSVTTTLTNQTLLIDGERKIVTIDGVNALNLFSGDFIDLEPNGNGFFFDGTNPRAHVTYSWKHKFI